MRTTLDIDDDVLVLAKDVAKAERKTAGQVISELARKALTTPSRPERSQAGLPGFAEEAQSFQSTGWHTLPNREGVLVTREAVQRVQQEIDQEDAAIAAGGARKVEQ